MTRKFFKRHIPDAKEFHKHSSFLSILGEHLHRPNLWHLNRRSVAKAFAVGLFCTWLPIPFQTVLAGLLAIIFCANLPLSVLLVFISNPFTMPPMFYFAYRLGSRLLGVIPEPLEFEFSIQWLGSIIDNAWQPLLLGCLVIAVISSALGYVFVRVVWRLHIIQRWKNRKL